MIHNVEVDGRSHYYKVRPENPRQGDIYAVETDNIIRAYVLNDDEWMLVTNMSNVTENKVNIECSDETDDDSEHIEQLDYQYRIGVV